jgi:hypothetical protein
VNHKPWWIFGFVEFTGVGAAFLAALMQDPLLWAVSCFFLLPGTLTSIPVYKHLHPGLGFFLVPSAVAVVTNVVLFVLALFLRTKLRQTKSRRGRVPEDLIRLWLGHAKQSITDFYAGGLEKDEAWRREWCEHAGLGFSIVGLLGLQIAAQITSPEAA